MLYQMLTGRVPFEADSTVGIVMKHINSPVPAVAENWPMLPETLNPVIAKAMAKEPDERYQTAHELTQAVAEALGTSVMAGPIMTRPADGGTGGGRGHSYRRAGAGSGLTLWRKLSVLAQSGRGACAARSPTRWPVCFRICSPPASSAVCSGAGWLWSWSPLLASSRLRRCAVSAPPVRLPRSPASATRAQPLASLTPRPPTADLGLARTATAAFQSALAQAAIATQAAATQTAATSAPPATTAAPRPTRVVSAFDGMVEVPVQAGPFLMGSSNADHAARDDEKPQIRVTLDGFWIDRTEVSVAQFQAFVAATDYKTDAERGCCSTGYELPGGLVYSPDPVYVSNANWLMPQGGGAPGGHGAPAGGAGELG